MSRSSSSIEKKIESTTDYTDYTDYTETDPICAFCEICGQKKKMEGMLWSVIDSTLGAAREKESKSTRRIGPVCPV